jgi:hypothetical protein
VTARPRPVRPGPALLLCYRPLRRFLRLPRRECERLLELEPLHWRWPTEAERKALGPAPGARRDAGA